MTIGLIGQWVVSVLVGAIGGLGGIALGTMTEFGRKIVSYPFDRRLQALRHTQDTQIENLRGELSRIGDRNIRSNEREYNAIVAAWESYVEASLATDNCVARLDEHADLSRLDRNELEEWIKDHELPTAAAESIRESKDPNRAYGRYLQWKSIVSATNQTWEARQCVRKQGIFIPRDLEVRFMNALNLLTIAHAAQRAELDSRVSETSLKMLERYFRESPDSFEALKDSARSRLMYDERALKKEAGACP